MLMRNVGAINRLWRASADAARVLAAPSYQVRLGLGLALTLTPTLTRTLTLALALALTLTLALTRQGGRVQHERAWRCGGDGARRGHGGMLQE